MCWDRSGWQDPTAEVVALARPVSRESDGCPQAQPCATRRCIPRRNEQDVGCACGVRVLHVEVVAGIHRMSGGRRRWREGNERGPDARAPIYSFSGFPGTGNRQSHAATGWRSEMRAASNDGLKTRAQNEHTLPADAR